jgi:hypothetical protein
MLRRPPLDAHSANRIGRGAIGIGLRILTNDIERVRIHFKRQSLLVSLAPTANRNNMLF